MPHHHDDGPTPLPTPTPLPEPDMFAAHGMDARDLLELVATLPPDTIVGLEPAIDDVAFHLAPLPPDPRGGSASLFGISAPPEWQAVATVLSGRAFDPDTPTERTRIVARVVLTRSGHSASTVTATDDEDRAPLLDGAAGGEGHVVDAMHRILGLPSPGSPPDPVDLALGVWAHGMLVRLFDLGELDLHDVVALHPGGLAPRPLRPSVEALVDATFRSTRNWDWDRVHRRASGGMMEMADLTPGEAAWMDPTMFGRWVIAHLPDPAAVVQLLEGHDFEQAAELVGAVVTGVQAARARKESRHIA